MEPDPVDELAAVLSQTLTANGLRLTTNRGGYVGGGQPHPMIDSDPNAITDIAKGLLARKVAEPSRSRPSGTGPNAATPATPPHDPQSVDDWDGRIADGRG